MPPASTRPSICIVSHLAYGAMTGGHTGFIGGVEWQTSLTAKWLATKGYAVSMLTWDEGGPVEECIDGVRVIKICRRESGLKGLRFVHPKWTGLVGAMRRANAEVYYHNCGECVTGQIALWTRLNRRGFVFSAAIDRDCEPSLPDLKTWKERLLYRYGIRKANQVVVQTETQRRRLREWSGVDAICIPMPCLGPGKAVFSPPAGPPAKRVLWIARIAKQKRPDRFLDIAQACPDISFDFVGPSVEGEYSHEVSRRARAIPNVTVHGPVSRDQLGLFYQRASCFCCTSDYEGFPNTFLEAWSHGLPIISTFDPDSLIRDRRLGIVAQDVPSLVSGIRTLLAAGDCYPQMSGNARQYYLENHSPEVVLPSFERVFLAAGLGRNGERGFEVNGKSDEDSEP